MGVEWALQRGALAQGCASAFVKYPREGINLGIGVTDNSIGLL